MTIDVPSTSTEVTTALIVAAGKGERLGAGDDRPKPLQRVVGVPLVARVMRAAAQGGIRRFVVVIGFGAAAMRRELPALVPEACDLILVENPQFERPNGVSLGAGVEALDAPFALLMSDHLFTPARLRRAREHFAATGRNLLVVQSADTFVGDPDDATRVVRDAGRVAQIGKELEPYDAVDTGMFVLRPESVREGLARVGDAPSISDVVRVIAEAGELDALEVPEGRWQDVDTLDDARLAEEMLYASLRKPNDGFLARHVNRRISLALSTRLWRVGLTPNVATLLTLLVGLAAGAAFAKSSAVAWGLLGATLFQLQSILDGVDGELARLLHKESRTGFWLDVACDNLTHMAVFGGIAWGLDRDGPPDGPWIVLGWLAVLGVAASFVAMAPLLRQRPGRRKVSPQTGLLGRLTDGLARRDFTYLLFPLAALGWLGGFLWAAAIGTWSFTAVVVGLRMRARRATQGRA